MVDIKDIKSRIQSYDDSEEALLICTDQESGVVFDQIVATCELLIEWSLEEGYPDKRDVLKRYVLARFDLDIATSDLHLLLWEHWMRMLADLGLIEIETTWAYPSKVLVKMEDILELRKHGAFRSH